MISSSPTSALEEGAICLDGAWSYKSGVPTIPLADLESTARLAAALAASAERSDVFLLDGPLGAGKTTLARLLVEHLGGDAERVASPTFTLMNRYDAGVDIIHIDAYRLKGPSELAALGFFEFAPACISIIEWAERVEGALPVDDCWRIRLEHASGGGRTATVTASPKRMESFAIAGRRLKVPDL